MKTKADFDKLTYSGDIYDCNDKEMLIYQTRAKRLIDRYNKTRSSIFGFAAKKNLIKRILKLNDGSAYIEPPFHANFGGKNVTIGKDFYANSNLTLVDDGEIIIGDHVMIGPNVTICTAAHPISPTLRNYGLQYNKKIVIGNSVWIGAGVIILPGVNIGDNTIIGAGSVVTKDLESNSVYVGNPARKLRDIVKDDYLYFDHGKKISDDILNKYK